MSEANQSRNPFRSQAAKHPHPPSPRLRRAGWAYRDIAGGTCYFDWHAGRGAECLLDFLVEVLKRLPHNATPEQAAELPPARIAAERKAKAEAVARAEAEQVA